MLRLRLPRSSSSSFRLADWLLVNIALTLLIAFIKPELLPVSLYKLSLIFLAGFGAYWFDRSASPYARPDAFLVQMEGEDGKRVSFSPDIPSAICFAVATLRRAIIMGAAMIGVALGA